jgi:ATP-binding cassette, subfamily A (ABC1), member 3
MNLTSPDVAAYFPQFMYESVLKSATNDPTFQFTMNTAPYPPLYQLEIRGDTTSAFNYTFLVGLAISLIPVVMVAFILREREDDLKHIQLISGMNLPAYWISNMIADILKVYVPIILILITAAFFSLDFHGTWILYLLFPWAIVPFTYATSFLFSNDTRAQISTLFIHFTVSGVLAPLVFLFQSYPPTFFLGD